MCIFSSMFSHITTAAPLVETSNIPTNLFFVLVLFSLLLFLFSSQNVIIKKSKVKYLLNILLYKTLTYKQLNIK